MLLFLRTALRFASGARLRVQMARQCARAGGFTIADKTAPFSWPWFAQGLVSSRLGRVSGVPLAGSVAGSSALLAGHPTPSAARAFRFSPSARHQTLSASKSHYNSATKQSREKDAPFPCTWFARGFVPSRLDRVSGVPCAGSVAGSSALLAGHPTPSAARARPRQARARHKSTSAPR